MNGFLEDFLRKEKIAFTKSEDLSKKSYIKIGVTADTVYPKDKNELISLIACLGELQIEYRIIGAMSNILLCSGAERYLYVSTELMRGASIENGRLTAMAGMRFSTLIRYAAANGFSLLPHLFGIPGSVGGMVYSNAGAYGCEIADGLLYARLVDLNNNRPITLSNADLGFAYRKSRLQTEKYMLIEAVFDLVACEESSVLRTVSEVTSRRRMTQPTDFRSLGSVFKRPVGDYAARLIDAAGLRGACVGDAAVSEKHAGFIVNMGSATAEDFLELTEIIKKKVYSLYGIMLREEIEILR